jgi:hypothetical protein
MNVCAAAASEAANRNGGFTAQEGRWAARKARKAQYVDESTDPRYLEYWDRMIGPQGGLPEGEQKTN